MKTFCLLLAILLLGSNLSAQTTNSSPSLDAYLGLSHLKIGMDLKDLKGKLKPIEGTSDESGRVYYSYISSDSFFSDENISVKNVKVKVFQNKVEEVEFTFNKFDDIKIFQIFREKYGMFTEKPNLHRDIYYWAGNTVKLTYNYSDNAGNPVAKFQLNL